MTTYTIRMHTNRDPESTSQDVTVESETPLWAAITGLERLAVPSLEHVTGIEIDPVPEATPPERSEAIHGHDHHD